MKHLENKVALITGGSRGMGAAIARKLALAGADIAITYVRSAKQATQLANDIREESGRQVLTIQADNADHIAVTNAVAQVIATKGHIDILVNNAGIYQYKLFAEHSVEEYDLMMNVNVKAVFVATLAAVKHMPAGGRIITIGSNMAERVSGPGGALYSMSKSALTGFTKGLARDLGPQGITVNLVQPGPTDTDMNPAASGHADALRSQMALGHYGNVSDIAALVEFIAGKEAGFITGASLTIDGGFNA
jgi:3-oxoacyl-[acyl-carrier protein] reductase